MKEIWKGIKGYEGLYQISNLGRVKSLERYVNHSHSGQILIKEKIKSISLDRNGYKFVKLYKNNKAKNLKIHRLLGLHFIKNISGFKYINHIDGNKENNQLGNLEWCTSSHNNHHAYDIGLKKKYKGEDNNNSVLTKDQVKYIKIELKNNRYGLCIELSRKFNVNYQTIYDIKNNRTWKEVSI